jgi:selenocysteine lyase/cysteine desulfurase
VAAEAALARVRAAIPLTATRAYLFAGGMAPLCEPARAALAEYAELCARDPIAGYRERPPLEAAALRADVERFIGAAPGSVAILDSTSRGNNLAAQMVPVRAGANVVVDATTYPSALAPWLLPASAGVELRTVPSDGELPLVDALAELVDERTAAISISHVCRLTGFRHTLRPLAELAHAHGALLLVDGAQSVGAVPLDVVADDVDLLAFGAMKWMLGRPGVAFLYVRPELSEVLAPPQAGPTGAPLAGGVPRFVPGARRHELSSLAWDALGATRSGLALLADVPSAAVEAHLRELAGRLLAGLLERGFSVDTPLGPERRAGVVAFRSQQPDALRLHLRARGVDVWGWERDGRMRADPHVYNTAEDVERFLDGLDAFAAAAAP